MIKLPDIIEQQIRAELRMEQPCLEGWTDAQRGIEMAELVMQVNPLCVVELGVFGGRSLIAQALAVKHLNRGVVIGVDPWRTADALEAEHVPANLDWWSKVDIHAIHRGFMEALWRLQLESHTLVIRAASQHAVRLITQPIDILTIDANHSELASCRDVELYLPRVNRGGYIHFDDCDWASTQKAQVMMEQLCETVKVSPDGHYKLYRKK